MHPFASSISHIGLKVLPTRHLACLVDPLAKIAPHKKRKRGRGKGQGTQGGSNGAADGLGPGTDGAEGAGAAALEPWRRETAVQVAVLQLLETLLQVCT